MPRHAKGARLWLRPERTISTTVYPARWFILDRGKHIATGCATHETAQAERCLADYIAAKHQPARQRRDIEQISIADVLSIYVEDLKLVDKEDALTIFGRLERLNDFWGSKTLAEVNGDTCREYARLRGSDGIARRELEDLRAAINHHGREGHHREIVRVVLPKKGRPRERWLTRDEAARLLQHCWRAREQQIIHRGPRKGESTRTDRRPLQHVARFILLALYTGSRASAVACASFERIEGRSFVDLENGLFHRLATGKRETKKRQPPVPLPPRLLAHLRRWRDRSISGLHVVEWNGEPVKSVKKALRGAADKAGLPDVSAHILRHTAATWLMQAGVDKWEAAGFLGMSVETLERVYGHHHPLHLKQAAMAIGYRKNRIVGKSLAKEHPANANDRQVIEKIGRSGRI